MWPSARGGTRSRWSDQNIAAWERYDYRDISGGNAFTNADATVVLFAMNNNFGNPGDVLEATLEVKTRRLLVANGITDFVREFPLEWNGHTYRYDFAFQGRRTILETNGRRWHDDPVDYEHDNEKWSVPGRYGYRIVLATWAKVTERPGELLRDVAA